MLSFSPWHSICLLFPTTKAIQRLLVQAETSPPGNRPNQKTLPIFPYRRPGDVTAERRPTDVSVFCKPMGGINYGAQVLAATTQFSVPHCQRICVRPLLAAGMVAITIIFVDRDHKGNAIHYRHLLLNCLPDQPCV